MTDRPDIAAIEARANAATPGPWVWRENGGRDMGRFDSEAQGYPVCTFGDASDYYPTQGEPPEAWDREFIAHARTDILALTAEVRRLTRERDAERAFLPMSEYPCELDPGPGVHWGPEVLLRFPPSEAWPHGPTYFVGWLEADMWVTRDPLEPMTCGGFHAEPDGFRFIAAAIRAAR